MADQAKGKEDKEDGKDYSEVIEFLKQHIKSYNRVIASQSSDIKTLLLSLNTLKASIKDSVSAIKNISSTLASLTNSSNAAATGKTSYSPRFDPFSCTIDLDSPLRPPRKEPYLGPAVNSATSNLDPPIDTRSKEGFKDTITSSIVKELSKKAYTIPDDKNPDISNTYSDSDQAVLLMLLRNSLFSSPRAAISRPIKSKKEDVYNEFHALTFSTYKKGLSAFNAEFNGYLAKLTMAKIDIDPSLILNQNPAIEAKKGKNKKKGKKKASYNVKGQNYSAKSAEQASFILGSYNLAIEEEEESDSSSNSRYKKRKDFKGKGLKTSSNKAKYKDNKPIRRPRDPALYNSWLYDIGSTDYISNSKERFTTFTPNTGQLRPINTVNGPVSPAGIGSITLEVLSRKAPPTYTKLVLDNVLYLPNIDINIVSGIVVEIPSNSIRKEDYRPIIKDAIVSEAIEPNKRYKLRNSPAKGTTLEGIGPSLREKRPCRPTREPEPLTGTEDLPRVLREPVIEGNKVEKAISSPTLKEPNIGQRDYYNLLNLAKLWHVRLGHIGLRLLKKTSSITKGLPNFDKIKEADFHCSSYDRGKAVRRVSKALIPDLPRVLDSIEGDTIKMRPRPYNRNPIVLLLVDRKSRYRWVFNLPNKSGPIVANAIKGFFRGLRNGFGRYPTKFHFNGGTEITDLLTTWLAKRGIKFSTSAPYIHEQNGLVERLVRVILDQGELVDLDLDLEGAISPDPSNLNTEKSISIEIGPSKLEPYESSSDSELDKPLLDKPMNPVIVESTRPTISIRKPKLPEAFPQTIEPILTPKPIEVIAPNQPITNEPLDNSDLISEGDKMQLDYYKLLVKTSSYILSFVYKARKRVISKDSTPTTYKQVLKLPRDEHTSNKAIYKLLLKYGYNPSTPNIIKLSKALYRVFYNAKTCHFIVTYIDDCLFIGPNIGYITDLKKRLNKVYAIEDLGPAAYFLGYIEEAVSRFNLADSKPISIPLQPGLVSQLQLEEDITSHLCNSTEIKLYQSLVGTAMYIMLLTRVDISFTVQWLSRSLNRPTKSHLNAAKNLFKYLNSTKDYSICFSYNGNTVADLGPKLSNSSNTTTKLSRDFHSKEGPRPLTTTSTTIVDSRNSKGSSWTSIINSSLVPIGFSDSDFAGDKATSKSTYGYLYKLAGRPISWKTKRATTIALSTLEAETDGLTEAIRKVQWIIGLFSELYRPIDYPITLYGDNQGSITVANDPVLHARTKYTLLKFRYVREQVKAKIVTIIYLNTNSSSSNNNSSSSSSNNSSSISSTSSNK
ncbi:hypothetical protein P8C59_008279 [Phyllachora maydis]|uniref:Integrase catalytic domain-containing protein n=1 Tax=Phyllachora maydis TaxID=1825666 RepID=A0AAD9MF14_9PEZI|nr:hypothetical protein P8C59_008279 [Phyllachora maydis]